MSEGKKYEIHLDNFDGPLDLLLHLIDKNKMDIYVDTELATMKNFVVGANKADTHIKNANINRDFKATKIVDLKNVKEGYACPICSFPVTFGGGITIENGSFLLSLPLLNKSFLSQYSYLFSSTCLKLYFVSIIHLLL